MLLISYMGICQKKLWSNCHSSQPFFCSYHSIKSQSVIPLVLCWVVVIRYWLLPLILKWLTHYNMSEADTVPSLFCSWLHHMCDGFQFLGYFTKRRFVCCLRDIFTHCHKKCHPISIFWKNSKILRTQDLSALTDTFLRWFIYL